MAREIDLQKAIDRADLGKVKRLLASGARASSKTSDGEPLLHWVAIRIWNFRGENQAKVAALREIGKLLVERGAPVDIHSAACLGLPRGAASGARRRVLAAQDHGPVRHPRE